MIRDLCFTRYLRQSIFPTVLYLKLTLPQVLLLGRVSLVMGRGAG